jgi:hypothetical protein
MGMKCGYECRLLVGIVIAWIILMWLLAGCTSQNRAGRMHLKTTEQCEWTFIGGETATGIEEFENSFNVGPDCTLIRKGAGGKAEAEYSKDTSEFH